jgi:hypothetical protein
MLAAVCLVFNSLSIYILYLSRIEAIATFENPIDNAGPIINIANDQNKKLVEPVWINLYKYTIPKIIVTKNKKYNAILGLAFVLICVAPFCNLITCPISVELYFTPLVYAGVTVQ